MTKHALLSASGAHRWLECTPSAQLELQFPQSTSEYAEEGTAAHELCELTARYWLGEISEAEYENQRDELAKGKYYNAEMQECANDYAKFVAEKTAAARETCEDAFTALEVRVDFSEYVKDGFGTGDCIIVSDNVLEIIDFKYGKGVRVEAAGNPQMKLYSAIWRWKPMYEDKTYEAILQEKLARVASSLDKREGSIIFDALAPNSLESAMIYVALDTVLNETFADTASRDYLIMRCAERGITPLPATCAVGIGEFSMDVPIGSRFSCDKYNWTVTERISAGQFYLTCETVGADPNGYTGLLIPIEYIDGLKTAELTSIAIHGEDEEETEALRLRYLNSFANQSYGFNRAQYIAVVEALPGVGGCKPYRASSSLSPTASLAYRPAS